MPDGVGGNGVTSIAAGTGLTAGPTNPITMAGTLGFDEAYGDGRYARLGAVNTFSANQNVNATLTVSKPSGNAIDAIGNPAGGIGIETSGYYGLCGTSPRLITESASPGTAEPPAPACRGWALPECSGRATRPVGVSAFTD